VVAEMASTAANVSAFFIGWRIVSLHAARASGWIV